MSANNLARACSAEGLDLPTASIIIPTLNEASFLPQCLESILAQRESLATEIIVVDNGSQDDTAAIAERMGVQVIRGTFPTIAAQRNAGASIAKAPLFGFLDADCTVHDEWIGNAPAHFGAPDVVAVGSTPQIPLRGTSWVQRTWAHLKMKPHKTARPVKWLASANLWVRASAFSRIGGFNEAFESCEDADLGYRLSHLGKLMYDPEVAIDHHREPRTLRQFLKKEIWHGKNSYGGFGNGRWTLEELPSLLVPIWYLLSYLLAIVGGIQLVSFQRPSLLLLGTIGLLAPPLIYSIRAVAQKGNPLGFPRYVIVYFTYFTARCIALLKAVVSGLLRNGRNGRNDRSDYARA